MVKFVIEDEYIEHRVVNSEEMAGLTCHCGEKMVKERRTVGFTWVCTCGNVVMPSTHIVPVVHATGYLTDEYTEDGEDAQP